MTRSLTISRSEHSEVPYEQAEHTTGPDSTKTITAHTVAKPDEAAAKKPQTDKQTGGILA
ncbi:hypothetical protein QSF38_000192 [Escherichia coli]